MVLSTIHLLVLICTIIQVECRMAFFWETRYPKDPEQYEQIIRQLRYDCEVQTNRTWDGWRLTLPNLPEKLYHDMLNDCISNLERERTKDIEWEYRFELFDNITWWQAVIAVAVLVVLVILVVAIIVIIYRKCLHPLFVSWF